MKYLLLLAIVATLHWVLANAIKCEESDRCVPIKSCHKFSERLKNKSKSAAKALRKEMNSLRCTPEVPQDKPHICCPKEEIGCVANGGLCLLRQQCPDYRSASEQSLNDHLCYVHNQEKYFCCKNNLCKIQRGLCEQPLTRKNMSNRRPQSAFPKCSNGAGTTVAKQLCDYDSSPSNVRAPSNKVCCREQIPDRIVPHRQAGKLSRMPCGTVDSDANKIFNGTHTFPGEFPWMAKLVYRKFGVCSGTLIHPLYVLTARHCARTTLTGVLLGVHDVRKIAKTSGIQEIAIEKIQKHDIYDVALLRLSEPAMINGDMVKPICLPLFANLRMSIPQNIIIAGWGVMENLRVSNVLMKANVIVTTATEKGCSNAHEICINPETAHSHHCQGDSGGPYQAMDVYKGTPKFVQFGIISNGVNLCTTTKSLNKGVLVGYVLDWILDNMDL